LSLSHVAESNISVSSALLPFFRAPIGGGISNEVAALLTLAQLAEKQPSESSVGWLGHRHELYIRSVRLYRSARYPIHCRFKEKSRSQASSIYCLLASLKTKALLCGWPRTETQPFALSGPSSRLMFCLMHPLNLSQLLNQGLLRLPPCTALCFRDAD
jgi:hypothetical protein